MTMYQSPAPEGSSKPTPSQSHQRWQPIWSQIPHNIVSIHDYELAARHHLPSSIQALLFENSLHIPDSNANALDKRHWLPQVLHPKPPNLSCHLYNPNAAAPLDIHLPHPLWLAPVAHQGLYHPDAERATLEAANLLQTPCMFSCMGNTLFEHLLPAASIVKAVQWYWQPLNQSDKSSPAHQKKLGQRQYNLTLINELIAKGMQILIITVDAPHAGVRPVSRRVGATLPHYCQAVNLGPSTDINNANLATNVHASLADLLAQAPNWEDIEWLVSHCSVPVLLKGIMNPQDAKRAKDIGCAGIVTSNHGRRVLPDVLPVAEILAKIREQVGDDMVIIADGGIRSGSDMAKLMALGADAVAIGRGYIYGLALAGALGVAHVNKVLLEELQVTMAVLGVKNLAELKDCLYKN